MRGLVFIAIVVVFLALPVNSGRQASSAKVKKPKKPASCPDTCKLRRRIAKFETSVKDKISAFERSAPENASSLTLDVNNTALVNRFLAELRENVLQQLQGDADEAIGQLKGILVEEQAAISTISAQVEEMIRSIPEAVSRLAPVPVLHNQSNPFTEDAIRAMNTTILTLKRQNTSLKKKTKIADNLARVIREQNIILGSQNNELRLHNQGLDRKHRELRQRVFELENSLAQVNATVVENSRSTDTSETDQHQLGPIHDSVSNIQASSNQAIERIERLEQWAQAVIDEGDFPDLLPTSHPQPDSPPSDCQELYQMGFQVSGIYTIRPYHSGESFDVYCEQEYYGGGWAMIQRRRDGSVNFDRDWDDYVSGFGELTSEFWLGNEKIHQITAQNTYRLHIAMLDWEDQRAYAEYSGFKLSSSRDYYSLRIGAYVGTAGDGLRGTDDNGSRNLYLARFTTRDFDNDQCSPCLYHGQAFNNCAEIQNGGWWYRACADANLNGRYYTREEMESCDHNVCQGIQWRTWHEEDNYSLRASMMLVKAISASDD